MGFSFFGLFGQTNKFKTVDVNEFEKFIADTSVVLLDVRTSAEYAEGFIPGTHFNIDVLEDTYIQNGHLGGVLDERSKLLYVHCLELIGLTEETEE